MANATDTLSPLQAYNLLLAFASRHGEHALRLAMHAALPQVLRVELLHLLRLNFVPESLLDRAVEADVLFAPFCQALSNGYYRFDPGVRLQLLQNLDPAYPGEPSPRSVQTARFLLSYFEHQDHNGMGQDRLYAEYLEVERWGALGFLKPEEAATQLAAALQQATESGEIAARLRIAGLTAALSTPLARYGRLLAYAAGLEAMESGQLGDARKLMESLGDDEIEVGAIKLQSPRRFLNEHLRSRVDAPAQPEEVTPESEPTEILRNKLLICYSHKDKIWLDQLLEYINPTEQAIEIELWDDTLPPDKEWQKKIREAIRTTKVVLLLVSSHFLASAYIAKQELIPLLEEAEQQGVVIIPVILSECLFSSSILSRFQELPVSGRALDSVSSEMRKALFIGIATSILRKFDSFAKTETAQKLDSLAAENPKKTIYISYGRDDSIDYSKRLADDLRKHFGKDNVWMADQSLLESPDFDNWIQRIIQQVAVMVMVIGPRWLNPTPSKKTQTEFILALEAGILIIPVLVGGAHLPPRKKLPGKLARLSDLQSIELKESTWNHDFASLRHSLQRQLDNTPEKNEAINPQRPTRVFISSTYADLIEHRGAVYQTLRKMGYEVAGMEDYFTSSTNPLLSSYKDIDSCEIFILIVAWRYGFIPPDNNPENLSINELGYLYARQANKPCLVFMPSGKILLPSSSVDAADGVGSVGGKILAFRDKLSKEQSVNYFDSVADLSQKLLLAVQRLKQDPTAPKDKPKPQSTYSHEPESFDVYLSHNSQDKPIVKELAEALRRRGLKVWLDVDQLVPGEPFTEIIGEKIQEIPAIAVLVGKSGISAWQNIEVQASVSRDSKEDHKVIPVLLPESPSEPHVLPILRKLAWVDLRNGLTEEGLDQLEWGITGIKPEKKDEHPRPNLTFYLSFAPEDSTAAHRLASELKELGADVVWFDRSQFKAEDEWEQKTTEAINACIYFIPLISAHTEARMEGYFYREWNLASRRLQEIAGRFVLPVMIDEADTWDISHYRGVPESFLKLQSGHAPGGALSESLRSDIAQCIREKLKESPRLA